MPASNNLLVVLNAREKTDLARQASRRGISMGEVVRRAVARFETSDDADMAQQESLIEGLVKALEVSTARAAASLDQARRDVAEARKTFSVASVSSSISPVVSTSSAGRAVRRSRTAKVA